MRVLLVRLLMSVAALVLAWPTVGANHMQSESGRIIVFDHVAGNEWWVEVALSGQDAGSVASVDAMDTGGSWVALQKKSWGPYAASFHVEPGHQVRFRASWAGGAQVLSCWFTHPAGVEQCGTGPAFDASFTGVRGNEWWVQANVATNGLAVAKMDVTLDNGATWNPLAKQSWGGWAASYHIVQGTIVRLRATATDGQTDLSSCRQWIPPSGQDAAIVTCPGTQPPAFDAAFTGVKGNEWWVQVNVAGNQPVASVMVRLECRADWQPLTKQSWGGWAASFQIPSGSKVDFQARTASFDSDVSAGYVWPQATPTSGCPLGDWPRQGSYVTYEITGGVCGGGNCQSTQARMHLVYDQGRWLGRCTAHDTFNGVDGTQTTRDWQSDHVGLPPSWLTPRTQVGAEHRPDQFHAYFGGTSCEMGWTSSPVYVERQEDVQVRHESSGTMKTVHAWFAMSRNDSDNLYTAHWDTRSGLVVDIDSAPRRSQQGHEHMVLVDTNAPLG